MNDVPWPRVIKLMLAVIAFLFFSMAPDLGETERLIGMAAAFGAVVLA